MNKRGFTLLEVLVVVVIAVMVSAFAVPSFKRSQSRNKNSTATGILMDIGNATRVMRADFPNLDFSGQVTSAHFSAANACLDKPTNACAINYMFGKKYLMTIPFDGSNTVKGYKFYVCGKGGGGGGCCTNERAATMQNTVSGDFYPTDKCAWVDNSGLLGNNY